MLSHSSIRSVPHLHPISYHEEAPCVSPHMLEPLFEAMSDRPVVRRMLSAHLPEWDCEPHAHLPWQPTSLHASLGSGGLSPVLQTAGRLLRSINSHMPVRGTTQCG